MAVFVSDYSFCEDLTGVILAGGKARRMGGEDKGLILYQDRPLIEHVIDRLAPQTESLLINANRNHEVYANFGYPVIADVHTGFLGPLSGMLAGLQSAQTSRVLFVPCDSPQIVPILATRLASALSQAAPGIRISVAQCEGRLQPVFVMMETLLAKALEDFLLTGGRKIDAFYEQQGYASMDFEDCTGFRNINTQEDLAC